MKRFDLTVILSPIMKPAVKRIAGLMSAPLLLGSLLMAPGCTGNEEPDSDPDKVEPTIRTSILIYAVASNNLSYDFNNDMAEVLEGAPGIDADKADVWVYSLTQKQAPTLSRLVWVEDKGEYAFEVRKEYDRKTFSTDPQRISEVIADYEELSKAPQRGLIFWSHATGWTPKFSDHIVADINESDIMPAALRSAPVISGSVEEDPRGWYGQDIYEGQADYCDLLELDSAIPESTFDFIWFDCCYMSSIEVVYQLRHKAPYIVAYPTEMAAEGLPYQITLPYLAAADYDLTEAAKATAQYFLDKNSVITICVTRTDALEEVAREAAKATEVSSKERPWAINLQKYSRSPSGPFYDFGQYTSEWGAKLGADWDEAAFRGAMEKAVVYKAASATGFDRREIKPENFSGLSCHYFYDDSTEETEYYKRLDWWKAVYPAFHQ